MIQYSGCDVHRDFSVFVEIHGDGEVSEPTRVDHDTGELEEPLERLPEGTPIAVETSGPWYWIVDRIEEMGHKPRLTHASKASRMMGFGDKTDSLDAKGLAVLQQNGTLPEVWIPPADQRDHREMLRFRMKLAQSRTRWKNRIHATLMKHGLDVSVSDAFGTCGRHQLEELAVQWPNHAREVLGQQLQHLDELLQRLEGVEERLDELLEDSSVRQRVRSIPGVGRILSAVLVLEIGDIGRFPGPGHLASYAGVVPGVHASGGKQHDTGLRERANTTLKWAYMEAANAVIRQQEVYSESRLIRKYHRLAKNKVSGVAKGAGARMLAESSYWVWSKEEAYVEPDGWKPPS